MKTTFIRFFCTRAILAGLILWTAAGCERESGNAPLSDQYFTFTFPGGNGAVTSPADTLGAIRTGDSTEIFGNTRDGKLQLYARFEGPATSGRYTVDSMSILAGNQLFVDSTLQVQAFIVDYGSQYIIGQYYGIIKDTAKNYRVDGIFRVKRR